MASSTYINDHWKVTMNACNSIDRHLCYQMVKFNKCTTIKGLMWLAVPLHSLSYLPSLVRFVSSPSNSLSGAEQGEMFQTARKNE